MPGRRPKPTKLKLLQGNPGKRKLNRTEPQPKVSLPDPPSHLSPAANEHWQTVAAQLAEVGLLTELDRDALGLYCEAFARWVDANQQIAKFGPLIKSPSGYPMPSPFLAIANKAFEQMRSMLTEFGMTPAARSRVHAQKTDNDDPMSEFMSRERAD